ncbi:hypothetical protein [Yinghuangia soli]|uniref:UDP-N-acetylmuramyl pentapeptide phosphotransferase/UDP-N-acetylglucosamine-1-phosphate transferase n=1 Tax=Yinghuangia soli TaxID=2908204 RepID=A0AA41U5G8_9ACTN|nr:hypothetical protein [Yinghuangia soli]MCF2531917.1 hypothetical protein [Yinghuangia soli]
MSSARRAVRTALVAGTAARVAYTVAGRVPPGRAVGERRNHRGEAVTLLEGPAAALGTALAAATAPGVPGRQRAAAVLATAAAAGFGAYDDLLGATDKRGFKGHLGALAKGEVTSGAVKILGIGATGLAAGALLQRRPVDKLLAGVVVAGTANAVNLFDLRPGRAAKVAVLAGLPGVLRGARLAAAPVGAAAALLPEDLGEKAMLGDTGANALGAALGVAAAAGASRRGLVVRAAALTALTLASEKVSFTKVIAGNPTLHKIDMLGRRPVAQRPAPAAEQTGERSGTQAGAAS